MCEESACLVPQLDQSPNGAPAPRLSPGSGGGACSAGEVLVGFHEDAISQTAVGRAQFLLSIVLGLAIAADCSELSILNFILPAAELQLCVDDHRKSWLVSITLLALATGSLAWGILGDHIGRRRSLVSALSVTALFSAMAVVMPTYGTFMTARFCSGLGIAGAVPLSFSYLAETCPRATRTRYAGLLHSFWPLGALLTTAMAHLTLPTDGADVVEDNREHWSSWHKFLLLNILPTIACILGLIWASESPRYLLEACREVEALAVYQRLHRLNKARTQYGLTELELPSRSAYREKPANNSRNVVNQSFQSVKNTLQRMVSPSHFRTTLLLVTLHFLLGFIYMGMSVFSTSWLKELNESKYNANKCYEHNKSFVGFIFNSTLENVQYKYSIFRNVTFSHLDFNHVEFINCFFEETEFSNVKTSITYFENSTFKDCRFIDTDFTKGQFINCNMINNTFLSLIADCKVDFDYNIYLDDLYHETMAWAGPMLLALIIMGFILEVSTRPPVLVVLLVLVSLSGIGIFFMVDFVSVVAVESVVKVLLMCAVNVISMVVVEGYPCYLRCTAHGIMRSLFHIASLCAIPIYNKLVHSILLFPAVITSAVAFFAAVLSIKVQDNSKALL